MWWQSDYYLNLCDVCTQQYRGFIEAHKRFATSSDRKVKAATSEALLRTSLSLDSSVALTVGLLLSLLVVLLSAFLLVVSSLHLL